MSPLPVLERPLARRDVRDIAVHLAGEASLAIASSFLDAVAGTYERLSRHPEIGALRDLPRLAGIRWTPIPGFPNHVILYTLRKERVEIVRVLHGARDLGVIEG